MKIKNITGLRMVQSLLLSATLFTCASMTGCVSSSKISHEASVGQQLEDLDKSYKDGIITKDEYERLRKAIIKKND
jgi:hypothetical protein